MASTLRIFVNINQFNKWLATWNWRAMGVGPRCKTLTLHWTLGTRIRSLVSCQKNAYHQSSGRWRFRWRQRISHGDRNSRRRSCLENRPKRSIWIVRYTCMLLINKAAIMTSMQRPSHCDTSSSIFRNWQPAFRGHSIDDIYCCHTLKKLPINIRDCSRETSYRPVRQRSRCSATYRLRSRADRQKIPNTRAESTRV